MWSDSFYPYVSGVTRTLKDLRDALTSRGHRVIVLAPRYPGALEEDDVFRFPSFRAPTNRDFYVPLPFAPGLRQFLAERRPEVVHIHSPFVAGELGIRTARHMGLPVIFTYHTMYSMYTHYAPLGGNLLKGAVQAYATHVANRTDLVIAPSTAVRDYLIACGVRKPVTVIPGGIKTSEFSRGDPQYLTRSGLVPGGRPVVLTAGRLAREKNLDVLLRAFATSRVADAVLAVAGDGPARHDLARLAAELGVSHRVFFLGKVNPDLMPHVYASAHVFLFTSMTETQGLVIVEAKASGLPVVAVAALGVKDAVVDGEDGFLVPNEPREIAAALDSLLEDESLRRRMGERAKENAEFFSLDRVADRLVSTYGELMKG